jgi:threonine dehydrogenase-like Zn-dependent dehydrogenase
MRAIVNTAPGRLEMLDWPLPEPGPGQVRIRTAACGVCATDLAMIAGWVRTGYPAIPGHEWAGTVDAVGPGVNANLLGCRCVAENVWADGGEVGFEHPGGYGEYFLTEAANVYPLPDSFPLTTAALIEPLAVCVRGLRRLRIEDKRRALVIGDGPIGLIMVMLLRRAGVEEIVLVGGRPGRLAVGRERGAAKTLNYHEVSDSLSAAIRGIGGDPFPNVLEVSGTHASIAAALEVVAHGGHVLVLGDYNGARADFAWNDLLHREIELIGSNASAGAWPEAVRLAIACPAFPGTEDSLPLARLVTHRLPAERFAEGIELMRSRRGDVIKVVLEWERI